MVCQFLLFSNAPAGLLILDLENPPPSRSHPQRLPPFQHTTKRLTRLNLVYSAPVWHFSSKTTRSRMQNPSGEPAMSNSPFYYPTNANLEDVGPVSEHWPDYTIVSLPFSR